jgi:alpha-ribazole phosphatase
LARLLLIRHAETEWTQEGRYQGHSQIGLSAKGIKQAERLRERLKGEKVNAIYTSDLRRAMETAQIIAFPHHLEVIPCSELREIDFGNLEGLTFDEAQQNYPWIEQRWSSPNPQQGESLSQLSSRVGRLAIRLRGLEAMSSIIIVSHGGPLRVLLCLLLGIEPERWWQFELGCASLSVVETYPQGMVLSLLNDVCHLK